MQFFKNKLTLQGKGVPSLISLVFSLKSLQNAAILIPLCPS